MKILLSTRSHNPVPFQELAQELGFDGIEVVMPTRRAGESFDASWSVDGLSKAAAVHAPVGCLDLVSYKTALTDGLELAKQLGASVVNIHPPSAADTYGGRQNVIEGINAIKAIESKYTQQICYEITPMTHRNKLIDGDEKSYDNIQAWCNDIAEFNLSATLDTTHIASWGENPADYVPVLGKNLKHIHASDDSKAEGQHMFPGEGEIKWSEFFTALKKENINDIYISIEPGSRFDLFNKDKTRLQKSLAFIRHYLEI